MRTNCRPKAGTSPPSDIQLQMAGEEANSFGLGPYERGPAEPRDHSPMYGMRQLCAGPSPATSARSNGGTWLAIGQRLHTYLVLMVAAHLLLLSKVSTSNLTATSRACGHRLSSRCLETTSLSHLFVGLSDDATDEEEKDRQVSWPSEKSSAQFQLRPPHESQLVQQHRSQKPSQEEDEKEGSQMERQQLSPADNNDNRGEATLATASSSSVTDTVRKSRHRRHTGAQSEAERRRKGGSAQPTPKRQVIHAMLRGQAVLACNLEPPEPGDAVSLVLWYKDKSTVPIYSVDARSAPIQEARHKPGPWLEGRSSLKLVAHSHKRQATGSRRRRSSSGAASNNVKPVQFQDPTGEPADASSGATLPEGRKLLMGPFNESQPIGDSEPRASDWPGSFGARRRRAGRARRSHRSHLGLAPTAESEEQLEESFARLSSAAWSLFGGSGAQPLERRHLAAEPRSEKEEYPPEALALEMRKPRDPDNDELLAPDEQQPDERPTTRPTSLASAEQQQQIGDSPALTAHLYIEALSSEDNGIYLCRVDFRRARSRTQETVLKIIVPADTPTIREVGGPRPAAIGNGHLLGPYDEGARLVLECETQGGYPEPVLTWWRDGRLVDDSYELVSSTDGLVLGQHGSHAPQASPGHTPEQFRQARPELAGPQQDMGAPMEGSVEQALDESHLEAPATDDGGVSPAPGAASGGEGSNKAVTQNRLIRNRLELNGLSRADLMANYSCQAWNTRLSEPPSSSVMIDMNLRPIKARIENERQPVLADKPLELLCTASGSRPPALISWWRGDVRLDPAAESAARRLLPGRPASVPAEQAQQQDQLGSNSSSTLLFVPQLADGGQIVTCRAENPHLATGSGARSSSHLAQSQVGGGYSGTPTWIEDTWKLDVHYLPRATLALGEKLNGLQIKEGQDVYFECTVRAHPVAHEVRWWFEGRELESNVTSGLIISNQSLVLQRVNRRQRGRYTCSAVNEVGEAHSNSVYLRVHYAPYCRDARQLTHLYKSQREANGAGPGDTINLAEAANSDFQDNELGGANSAGSPFTALSQQRFKTHYGAARLEPVKVYCHVDADPAELITYKWAFVASATGSTSASQEQQQQQSSTGSGPAATPIGSAQRPAFAGQQLVYLDNTGSQPAPPASDASPLVGVATYTPRSELDYGTLLCWARNELGEQTEPCVYQIVPAERPDPVRNCRLVNASDSQLTVACEPGYDGGIDQRFQMEVYDSRRSELVANVSSSGGGGARPGNSGADTWWQQAAGARPEAQSGSDESGGWAGEAGPSSGSRQPKQRHSQQAAAAAAAAAAGQLRTASATSDTYEEQQQGGPTNGETLFVTGPNLKPATDYFLSIYSTNSKGSSKPVAFTATTAQAVGLVETSSGGLASSVSSNALSDNPSHLLSDVLALSWSPFLLVVAITLAIFALFASITFAMMKYADFSGASLSSLTGASGSATGKGPEAFYTSSVRSHSSTPPPGREGSAALAASANELQEEPNRNSSHRARVITVAGPEKARVHLAGGANETPEARPASGGGPNCAPCQQLNGGYKVQQCRGEHAAACLPLGPLKQSNSETYLSQLGGSPASGASGHQWQGLAAEGVQSRGAGLSLAERYQRQQQQPANQFFAGTLPKNMSSINLQRHLHLFAQPTSSASRRACLTQAMLEQPVSGANSADLSSRQHELMLASPAASLPGGYEPRVEQLVISGKQYIHHQTANQRSLYLQQQQQRHLQLTSGQAPYGSLQRAPANLYGPIKDYHHGQQQLVFVGQRTPNSAGSEPNGQSVAHTQLKAQQQPINSRATECAGTNCKTSDLGSDELPPGADGYAHVVAHLALIDGATRCATTRDSETPPGSQVLEHSDGLTSSSAGTNRSMAQTSSQGSPSSGVACELECNLKRRCQHQHSTARCAQSNGASSASSNSTLISSDQQTQQQLVVECSEAGGALVGVIAPPPPPPSVTLLHSNHSVATNQLHTSSSNNSNNNRTKPPHHNISSNGFNRPQPLIGISKESNNQLLDQYTVYVEQAANGISGEQRYLDANNNIDAEKGLAEFYVLPIHELDACTNKARVRLVAESQPQDRYPTTGALQIGPSGSHHRQLKPYPGVSSTDLINSPPDEILAAMANYGQLANQMNSNEQQQVDGSMDLQTDV